MLTILSSSLLIKGDINGKDLTGRAPIQWAYELMHEESVRMLLAMGASPFFPKRTLLLNDSPNYATIKTLVDAAVWLHFGARRLKFKQRVQFWANRLPFNHEFLLENNKQLIYLKSNLLEFFDSKK